jgi:nicotinamidase-related amidase
VQHLRDLDVDTVICTGCTTSGCVRASVVDAFSYHFRVGVVEECTFDRAQASHNASLFDMNAKYADVVSVERTKEYFKSLRGAPVVAGQIAG